MDLYNKYLMEILALLTPMEGKQLNYKTDRNWEDVDQKNMILRHDMAYELGGSNLYAISGIGFTDNDQIVSKDEVLLYGPDLVDIKNDISYARITLVNVETGQLKTKEMLQKTYNLFRDIEYERYHVNPKGYMMRISTVGNREPVRIGKQELEEGLGFAHAAGLLMKAYKKHKQVRAVKIIYITDSQFSFKDLHHTVSQLEKVTGSLDFMFKNLKMDCTICNLKDVCDEVDGLRKLHFN